MNKPMSLQPNDHGPSLSQSYLLRLWRTEQCAMECWRASLQDARTGERIGFANLEELFAFLMQQVEAPGSGSSKQSRKD